jgi:hypothetical protein
VVGLIGRNGADHLLARPMIGAGTGTVDTRAFRPSRLGL